MIDNQPSVLGVFSLFVLGIEAIVGLVLGLSDGLSMVHKTVLVGFVVSFPVVTLGLLLTLIWRDTSADQSMVDLQQIDPS